MKKLLITIGILFATVLISFFTLKNYAFARIGVGVATGKIIIDEDLVPGIIYDLPPLTVLNTGDEPSEYTVGIAYHEGQSEMKPGEDWFTYRPSRFHLEPNQAQKVEITLNVPIKTEPGDYFAYLEGSPIKKVDNGETTIGIAAAAKLYFTVAPANIFQAIYYRAKSFWIAYSPWTNIASGVVLAVFIIMILKKHLSINIKINQRPHPPESERM